MPKSRRHGELSVYAIRGGKLWRAVSEGERDENGKRTIVDAHGRDEKTARRNHAKKVQEIARNGGRKLDRRTRVSDLAARWRRHLDEIALTPKGKRGYLDNLDNYIVPLLGTLVVDALTKADITKFHTQTLARARKNPRAKGGVSTVASVHRTLVTMLNYAIDQGVTAENIATKHGAPAQPKPQDIERDSLTRTEAKRLLEHSVRWRLYVESGARSGEIRGLRWTSVDWEGERIRLDWQAAEVPFAHGCGVAADGTPTCGKKTAGYCPGRRLDIDPAQFDFEPIVGRWVWKRPKGEKRRVIPLTPRLRSELERWRDENRAKENPFDLVFHRDDGWPEDNRAENIALRSDLESLGIKRPGETVTMHWLRHTFVTLSEQAGVPWAAYGAVSGQSEEAARLYRHQLEGESRRGVVTLAEFIDQAAEG